MTKKLTELDKIYNALKRERDAKIIVKVNEMFAGCLSVTNINDRSFDIEFEDRNTSFADMEEISKVFGTRNINFKSESREGGYCETCSYSYTVNIVTVADISGEWSIV